MKLTRCALFVLALACLPAMSMAQTDAFGIIDTVYADLAQIDKATWAVTISYTNDETVLGLSVPFSLDAGETKIVADSAIYTGGRVEHFAYKGFRPDTATQCITMGMVANLGPTTNKLYPGSGRLMTFYVSSLDKSPVEKLTIDTTTTHPQNSLLIVADAIQKMDGKIDTIPQERRKEMEIVPVFVVRHEK